LVSTLEILKCDILISNFAFKFNVLCRYNMQRSTDYLRNRRRSLRPYLNSLPAEVHPVLLQVGLALFITLFCSQNIN
jgi:hypothetical protein